MLTFILHDCAILYMNCYIYLYDYIRIQLDFILNVLFIGLLHYDIKNIKENYRLLLLLIIPMHIFGDMDTLNLKLLKQLNVN